MSTLSPLSLALLTLPSAAWWEFKKSLVLLLLSLLLHSSMPQKWEDEKYPSHAMGQLRGFKTLCLLPAPSPLPSSPHNYKILLLTCKCERKLHFPFLHPVWATFYAGNCTQIFHTCVPLTGLLHTFEKKCEIIVSIKTASIILFLNGYYPLHRI